MKTHVTIAFYGNFRPLHVESETIAEAVKSAAKRISCPDIKATLRKLLRDSQRQHKAGVSLASSSMHIGGVCVGIANYPRNPWLDSVTDSMPLNPLISY